LLPTHIADIQILLPRGIIGHINHITLLASLITRTCGLRAGNHLNVRQCVILPGEFIDHDLKGLGRLLLDKGLRNKTTLGIYLRIATLHTVPVETFLLSSTGLQIKIIFARRTELHTILCSVRKFNFIPV
jgi:hypothetical protein